MNLFAANAMQKQPITFDLVVRNLMGVAVVVLIGLIIKRLSNVLLPFFIAWLLAYLMYPLVCFLQYRCRLRNRTLSVVAAFIILFAAIAGLLWLVLPPTITELSRLNVFIRDFINQHFGEDGIAPWLREVIRSTSDTKNNQLMSIFQEHDFIHALQSGFGYLWDFVYGTLGFAFGVIGSLIVLLYMFFILQDYEKISQGWVSLIPPRHRPFAEQLSEDVKQGMNSYFRGQATVAFCVGVLFTIGFLIIDFPMAIGLGLFIGFLNLVPYLQLLGFVPMILLALLKAAETGQNFWGIFLLGVIVICVVQLIQDTILVPRIMGSAMGLKPAVILLSLSIWGSLLGFIGLIIALPLTTLLISYYKQFVLKEKKTE